MTKTEKWLLVGLIALVAALSATVDVALTQKAKRKASEVLAVQKNDTLRAVRLLLRDVRHQADSLIEVSQKQNKTINQGQTNYENATNSENERIRAARAGVAVLPDDELQRRLRAILDGERPRSR